MQSEISSSHARDEQRVQIAAVRSQTLASENTLVASASLRQAGLQNIERAKHPQAQNMNIRCHPKPASSTTLQQAVKRRSHVYVQ